MSPYVKTVLRSIRMTLPRFLAIFAIIALGVGFFTGLKETTPSFVYTANLYADEYAMFDFKFLSTIGFKKEDIDELSKRTGCTVEGAYTADCSAYLGSSDSADTVRFLSVTNNVNKLKLEAGRMPEKPDEIVIDGYRLSETHIGEKLVIADEPTTALDVTIQAQIVELLRELNRKRGLSIIFISHNINLVSDLCDNIIVMYGGLVMERFPAESIRSGRTGENGPSHPYTLALLASTPRFGTHYTEERLVSIPGRVSDPAHPDKGCPFAPRCAYSREQCRSGRDKCWKMCENSANVSYN